MRRFWIALIGLVGLAAADSPAQDCPPPRRCVHHNHPPRVGIVESVAIVNLGPRPQRTAERARDEQAEKAREERAEEMLNQSKALTDKVVDLEQRLDRLIGILEQEVTKVESINQRLRDIEAKVLLQEMNRNQNPQAGNKPASLRRIDFTSPPAN